MKKVLFAIVLVTLIIFLYTKLSGSLRLPTPIYGYFVGGVARGGPTEAGFHPCVDNTTEANSVINQLISYQLCSEKDQECLLNKNKPVSLLTEDELSRNFKISETDKFFIVDIVGRDFSSKYTQSNRKMYICNSNYVDYINTSYSRYVSERPDFYPYSVDPSFLINDEREFDKTKLQDPSIGLAKISTNQSVDKEFMNDFMNYLYKIKYLNYKWSIMNLDIKILDRDIKEYKDKIVVKDIVRHTTRSDTGSGITERYKMSFTIEYEKNTRVVTSVLERL